jgi:hypothetical protein
VWISAFTALDPLNVFFSVDESEILVGGIRGFYDFEVRVGTEIFLKQVDEVLISGLSENMPQVILFEFVTIDDGKVVHFCSRAQGAGRV